MSVFRRRAEPPPGARITSAPPAPALDWSEDDRIRAEWPPGQLEGAAGGRLGWGNGMALYEQNPAPGQYLNIAEYLTRGLAYTYLGKPLISDAQAAESVRRILHLISALPPGGPAVLDHIAARLARLALAVTRQKGWQPASLGGDGQIPDELLRPPAVVEAIGAPA
ncbi:hypothetical protein [Paractinoplanes durhamensis]|uniref:hypothetical protein n=1 Tax=Paractinoplanes durhamensis TaxID=113563 RepID=UPI003625D29A